MLKNVSILILVLSTVGCMKKHGFFEEPFPNEPVLEIAPMTQPQPLSKGSLYTDQNAMAGYVSDIKPYRVNDIILVQINESTTATSSATTETERKNEKGLGISNLFGLENKDGVPRTDLNPAAMVTAGSESTHDASGTTQRVGSVTGSLAARVTQVLPNGYLMIQGYKSIHVNSEKGRIYLSGLVNPLMIGKDGSIFTSQIADLRLRYGGEGVVTAQQDPGWLSRVLTFLWPF